MPEGLSMLPTPTAAMTKADLRKHYTEACAQLDVATADRRELHLLHVQMVEAFHDASQSAASLDANRRVEIAELRARLVAVTGQPF